MMRRRMRCASASLALLGLLVSLLAITGMATSAQAASSECVTVLSGDPTKVPAPECVDRSGKSQDGFNVPDVSNATYMSPDEYYYYNPGFNSARGLAQLDVRTTYYDSTQGRSVEGPVYRLTFSHEVTDAVQAPNDYVLKLLGGCSGGAYDTELYFVNVADETDLFIEEVDLMIVSYSGDSGTTSPFIAKMVQDGETRLMGSIELLPGRHKVTVAYNRGPFRKLGDDVIVPKCGSGEPPVTVPEQTAKPRGSLDRNGARVIARMINKNVNSATRFRAVIARANRPRRRLTYTVAADDARRVTLRRLGRDARVSLQYRAGQRWKLLDRLRLT